MRNFISFLDYTQIPWSLCGKQKVSSKQPDLHTCRDFGGTNKSIGFQYNPKSHDCVVWGQIYGICPLATTIETFDFIKTNYSTDIPALLKKVIEYGKSIFGAYIGNTPPQIKSCSMILQASTKAS